MQRLAALLAAVLTILPLAPYGAQAASPDPKKMVLTRPEVPQQLRLAEAYYVTARKEAAASGWTEARLRKAGYLTGYSVTYFLRPNASGLAPPWRGVVVIFDSAKIWATNADARNALPAGSKMGRGCVEARMGITGSSARASRSPAVILLRAHRPFPTTRSSGATDK
jgi:hypothetical protein